MEVMNSVPVGLAWFWCHAEDVDEILDYDFLDTDVDNFK